MNSQRGFSLIEALIALVVLTIGLISVASIQLKALQSANAGYQRSMASVAAVDAQERIWAEWAENGCANIDVEDEWKAHWFSDNDANPLRNVNQQASGIDQSDCAFTIGIDLNSRASDTESDIFTYTFRLPEP